MDNNNDEELVRELCKKIAREIMEELQEETEVRMDPDNPKLHSLWDEIVVQNVFQHGIGWDLTEEHVKALILDKVRSLRMDEQTLIWLQTNSGTDWELEDEEERGKPVFDDDEIAYYVLHEYVYRLADEHATSDERLSRYIDRLTS